MGPVLEYKKFAMDRFLVQALIQLWNPESSTFMIGRREVQFSQYDVALVTGLPAMGREVVFTRGKTVGEVEQLLMGTMEEKLEKERGKRQGNRAESRMYRNYIAVIIELCKKYSSGDSIPMFRKLFSLLVVSGLYFARTAGGVAWDLINVVEDVDSLGEYNWAGAVWQFLVGALGETKQKLGTTKNVQMNGFVMVLQVGDLLLLESDGHVCILCCNVTNGMLLVQCLKCDRYGYMSTPLNGWKTMRRRCQEFVAGRTST